MGLSDMANASNERREQTIMKLRSAFLHKQVVTVAAAEKQFSVSRTTMLRYCKDGNIPLFDTEKRQTVVPRTRDNTPAWLAAMMS